MLNDAQIVRKRPHFSLRDHAFHFLNSKRATLELTDAERGVAEALAVPRRVQDLVAQFGAGAEPVILKLSQSGICDVITPVEGARKKVLVVEPHSDDAALSIGATMWQRRHEMEFKLVTLASRSNYTSSFHTGRPFFERDTVSALRTEEGEIFTQYLGGHYVTLGLNEATLRYHDADWSQEFFKDHLSAVYASNNRRVAQEVFAQWKQAVEKLLQEDDAEELWIPLGAGTHSDHELARNALLSVLMEKSALFGKYDRVLLYQDVPYDSDFKEHLARILSELSRAGAGLRDEKVDVTEDFDVKMDLLSVYASQFKAAHVRKGVEVSASSAETEGRLYEHLWHLERLPSRLDFSSIHIDAPKVAAVGADIETWLQGARQAKRLYILAVAASGRWANDVALLRKHFPEARIDVYAGPGAIAEMREQPFPNVQIHAVTRGSVEWGLLAAKLALSAPSHTLFVAGERTAAAEKMRRLWPFSKTLVVEAMDHFCLALQARKVG